MKRIVYTDNGNTCVVVPAYGGKREDETEDEFIARVRARAVPPHAAAVQVIDKADVPSDRRFRNAWRAANGTISVDMSRARDIHMARIRATRDRLLAASDAEVVRANDIGTEQERNALRQKRQTLRDLPQSVQGQVASAQTPDELAAVWPEILG